MKPRTQIQATCDKMDKICKVDSERAALKSFNDKIDSVWYELFLGETISTTIYALAYDTDKNVMAKRLMKSEENLDRTRKNMDLKL